MTFWLFQLLWTQYTIILTYDCVTWNGYTFYDPGFLLIQFCKQLLRVCAGLQRDLVAFVALGRLFLLSYLHCCDGGLVGGRYRLDHLRHVGPLGVRVGVELDKLTAGRRNWMQVGPVYIYVRQPATCLQQPATCLQQPATCLQQPAPTSGACL